MYDIIHIRNRRDVFGDILSHERIARCVCVCVCVSVVGRGRVEAYQSIILPYNRKLGRANYVIPFNKQPRRDKRKTSPDT